MYDGENAARDPRLSFFLSPFCLTLSAPCPMVASVAAMSRATPPKGAHCGKLD